MRVPFVFLLVVFAATSTAHALPAPIETPRNLAFWPGDVSGPSEGALAVPVDPAAAGWAHGPELVLRRAPSVGSGGFGALGLDGVLPLGPLALQAGWSLDRLPSPRARSARLGLSLDVGAGVRVGLAWQRLQAPRTGRYRDVFDVGVALRLHPVVSVSLGGESLGAPTWEPEGLSAHRGLRLGVGLRPLRGSPTLTLGLDARLQVTARGKLPDTRALIDVLPWGRGLHLLVAWQRGPNGQAAWAGVRVDARNFALGGAGRFDGDARAGHGAERMALVARLQARPDDVSLPRPHRRLQLEVTGALGTESAGLWSRPPAVSTLAAQLVRLAERRASGAADVDELLLDVGQLDAGLASVDELRAAILALRRAGVHVTARLTHGGSKEMLLAAAADRVQMDPAGSLDLTGFVARRRYYAEALAHVGVRFEAVGVGRYKSGPDGFTRAGPRPEEGEVQQARVDVAYATLREALQRDRHLGEARAHAALAQGLVGAVEAQGLGLVDEVAPRVQADVGQTSSVARGTPLAAAQAPSARWGAPPRIAVVPIVGVMEDSTALGTARAVDALGLGGGRAADAHDIARRLGELSRDPGVVGIVLRVDSPGGDVFAAERVWRAVRDAAQHKPLVASLGDVAASGGYYAAVAAPVIFAERNTLTGSVGIYRLKPEISGLLARLDVHTDGRSQGEHAGWDALDAPWTAADRERICRELTRYYDAFVERVAAGRKLTQARTQQLAQGRVYTGEAALALELVDYAGGLGDAVAYVRQQAGLAAEDAVTLDVPSATPSLLGWARHQLTAAAAPTAGASGALSEALRDAALQLRRGGRLPLALLYEGTDVEQAAR